MKRGKNLGHEDDPNHELSDSLSLDLFEAKKFRRDILRPFLL